MNWSFDSSESIVNPRCPITGQLIDPAKIAERHTRHWKGHVIGFCSPVSAAAWDALSDKEKGEHLSKVAVHHLI